MSGGAEAVLSMEPSSSVSVLYHPSFGSHNDIFLLEVDQSILLDFLHQRVTLRGEPDEDAVVCTRSRTYGVKFVGTSNSLLLVPPLGQLGPGGTSQQERGQGSKKEAAAGGSGGVDARRAASVIGVAAGSMELVEVAPRLQRLRLLLSECPLSLAGEEEEEEEDGMVGGAARYSWDDLVERIQASDDELRDGLRSLSAVQINGYWRSVDRRLLDMLLKMLLHNSVLSGWSLGALDEARVVETLASDGFIPQLSRHCLSVYANKTGGEAGSTCTWELDVRRVCVHFAREILRAGGGDGDDKTNTSPNAKKKKKMRMDEFMEEWSSRVPRGMEVNFEMLDGEVLAERIGAHAWVYGFSASSLPATPAECFSALFQHRPRWAWKDLHPYVRYPLPL